MSLFKFLDNSDAKDWIMLEKKSSIVINNFNNYLEKLFSKIETFQFLFLKLNDFENLHFYEKYDLKLYHNKDVAKSKIFEHYHSIVKRNLIKIRKLIEYELYVDKNEEGELKLIHNKLKERLLVFYDEDLDNFKKTFEGLEKNLNIQYNFLNSILSNFDRFVGNKDYWDECYYSLYSEDKIYYKDVYLDKSNIFDEWDLFLDNILNLKNLLINEVKLIYGINLNVGEVAKWIIQLKKNVNNLEIYKTLNEINDESKKYEFYSKDNTVSVFHATESPYGVFPLTEGRFPKGFYVCRDKKEYAFAIKSVQAIDINSIKVISIKIPESIFNKFFIVDNHYGNEKLVGSKEAYNNAYYLPVSLYANFNKFLSLGFINNIN